MREYLRRQSAERDQDRADWEDYGLVFPPRRGTRMEPDNPRLSTPQPQ
jgi:hypothetical protein